MTYESETHTDSRNRARYQLTLVRYALRLLGDGMTSGTGIALAITYCAPSVRIVVDFATKRTTVKGWIGIAPTHDAIIEYPVNKQESGYWSKAEARKVAADMKRAIKAELVARGLTPTEPFEYVERW